MATMVLRFPGGRYHATPGGHHVNEGVIEWPPSPWRLLRALIACGYATQQWIEMPAAGRRLVQALSAVLPEFRLPPAAMGHSRHYMPMARFKDGREETSLVLDAFADVGAGALWVRWPVALDAESQALFDVLVANLGYLGRSESWVLGETVDDAAPIPRGGVAVPCVEGQPAGPRFEQVALSAPEHPDVYAGWRAAAVDAGVAALGHPAGAKPKAAMQKKFDEVRSAYPEDLVDCLQRDSAWWQKHQWSRAPGLRTVLYWREAGSLQVGPPAPARSVSEQRVDMMLLALTTPSGSMSALPAVARTLPQAELLHRALVSRLGYGGAPCPELVGRDDTGEPLHGHAHAHVLPIDLDGDGRIDHTVVFAAMGLGARAQRAIRDLRRTYTKGGVGELQVAIAGVGALSDLRRLPAALIGGVDALLGPNGGASSWVSATSYVPPRHLKARGRSALVGQIEAELHSRGFPTARVQVLPWADDTLSLRHFVVRRQRGPQPPRDVGFAVRLDFERPVNGPVCIGYASHFGLGRFRAVV
jgi:CRISPR-associated protein Csb2